MYLKKIVKRGLKKKIKTPKYPVDREPLPAVRPAYASDTIERRYKVAQLIARTQISNDQSPDHPIEPWGKRLVVYNKSLKEPKKTFREWCAKGMIKPKQQVLYKYDSNGNRIRAEPSLAFCTFNLIPLFFLTLNLQYF
eukprot:GHVL01036842.1.p1 GENE.GHVL01036842.1~~GHVL01036842.1.p1  ORF type:complete len:138 (+),score=16.33 GHVL01036842.1:27-440(+)